MVEQWIKDLTESILGSAPFAVGDIVKHPDGRTVKITSGQYWGTHGISNFWYWREVLPNGELGPEEHGYGWRTETPQIQQDVKVIINPGSGPCHDAQESYAAENIKQFVKDCEVEGLEWERRPDLDMGGGRFAFIVKDKRLSFEIQMPGLPLNKVRFMDEPGQNLPDFPRLYRDKSSWWWKWALISKKRYEEKKEIES